MNKQQKDYIDNIWSNHTYYDSTNELILSIYTKESFQKYFEDYSSIDSTPDLYYIKRNNDSVAIESNLTFIQASDHLHGMMMKIVNSSNKDLIKYNKGQNFIYKYFETDTTYSYTLEKHER